MNIANRPGFWRGAGAALMLSAAGALTFNGLNAVLETALAARVVVASLGLAYLLLVLHDSGARIGRLVTLGGWLALSAALALFDPRLGLWLLAQTGLVWLVRCLYAHDSLRAAGLDALLSALALVAAVSAAQHTNSVFLTLWSYFLVQALYGAIPARSQAPANTPDDAETFEQAWRGAESALRRLAAQSDGSRSSTHS